VKKKVIDNNLCTISDICRLEWIKQELLNYEIVIWADIDLLLFNPSNIHLDLKSNYGFSFEIHTEHNNLPQSGLNNAFMFFGRNCDLLNLYLSKAYETLESLEAIDRTALGPSLLRKLNISDRHIINGLNILGFFGSTQIYKNAQKGKAEYIAAHATYTKSPIGGVNLCLNERSKYTGADRDLYDLILDGVSKELLVGLTAND